MRSEVLDWSSWKNVLKNSSFVGEKSFVLHILGSTNAAELTDRGLTGSCWISVPQGCRWWKLWGPQLWYGPEAHISLCLLQGAQQI